MKSALSFSFLFLFAFLLSILFSWYAAALLFFSLAPIMVIYTIYRVLRDPQKVGQKFDQQFYQDQPYQRNTHP